MSENKHKHDEGCCGGKGEHKHGEGCCGGKGEHKHGEGCCGGKGEHKHGEGCCGGKGEHKHGEGCCGNGEHKHGEDCCDEHDEQYLTLLLENDETLKCSVIEIFEVDDKEYIALLPVGDDQILLYRYVEHNEKDFELLNIETDEEFEKVEDAFFEIYQEAMFEEDEEYDYEYEDEEYDYDDYDDEEDEK